MPSEKELSSPVLISEHDFCEIIEYPQTGYKALVSRKYFDTGDLISLFSGGKILETPNYLTVQIDESRHISLNPEFLQYINHSCDPNVFFDTEKMQLIALKPIKFGEQFSFFYPSTEWEMDRPFDCHCGAQDCMGKIKGAKHIEKKLLFSYCINAFIKKKKEQEKQ